jgi:hypothetical protein
LRVRFFIFAVATMAILAAMIVIENVRQSSAPLYGAPNVDRSLVMQKVAGGSLSFKEARFYSIEDAGAAADGAGARAGAEEGAQAGAEEDAQAEGGSAAGG